MRMLLLLGLCSFLLHPLFADDRSLLIDSPSQMVPRVLKDPKTKVIFYLESNRHHLSAISPAGVLLWQVDTWTWRPFEKGDSKANMLINFISLFVFGSTNNLENLTDAQWISMRLGAKDDYLNVSFNTGAFGLIQKSTGKLEFLGQD